MRPENVLWSGRLARTGGVQLPDSLLTRARARKLQQRRRQQRAEEVGRWAHQALCEVLRCLDSGALRAGAESAPLPPLDAEGAVEEVSPHRPGAYAIAFDYRPAAGGWLHSRLARRLAEDPSLLRDSQASLERALGAMGYACRFHTHLVQRFVSSRGRGYHATVRVQVLVALSRKPPSSGLDHVGRGECAT